MGNITEDILEAERLTKEKYYQVSRKFRNLAQLPKGINGSDIDKDCYLRTHKYIQVSQRVFDLYLDLGGGTYNSSRFCEEEEVECQDK